jgi:pimeloyl-ACP methyl ester carboxylesterase
MDTITTKDGVDIYYKDWGPKDAQPLVFHHGWPLSSDDWDAQLLYFLGKGYRVVAHDRRGHGRSSQVSDGHDMDHYAADASAVVEHLHLKNAVHIGHSTGGGEVARLTSLIRTFSPLSEPDMCRRSHAPFRIVAMGVTALRLHDARCCLGQFCVSRQSPNL